MANDDRVIRNAPGLAPAGGVVDGTYDFAYLSIDSVSGALKTDATITGDVNVDSTSVDTTGLVGKVSGGDFDVAYTSGTTLTCTSFSAYHPTLLADDIVTIVQIDTLGAVTNTYSRDDIAITVALNVITVGTASFVATDTFVIYTNIDRTEAYDSSLDIIKTIDHSPEKDWNTGYVTLVTEQDLTTSEANYGSSIDVTEVKTLTLEITADVNTSQDCTLYIYTQQVSGGTESTPQLGYPSSVTLWSGVGTDFIHTYYLDVTGDTFVQLKAKVGTLGSAGDLSIAIRKTY